MIIFASGGAIGSLRHKGIDNSSLLCIIHPRGGIMPNTIATELKVADEVWIAAALLHREHPAARDFAVDEIVERARREGLHSPLRRGVYVHVIQHCVANRPPNPGRYRMLFETSSGRRRLFRPGDPYHPQREGAKASPGPDEIPRSYSGLLIWYSAWCAAATGEALDKDPLL